MKRSFLSVVALLCAAAGSYACDMCGGGSGSQYIGLLPAFNRNFAGIQYYSSCNTNCLPGNNAVTDPESKVTDRFNTIQIWGRHCIGKRYMLFAFIPYQYNVHYEGSNRSVLNGPGDATIMVNRLIVKPAENEWKHTVFGGLGVKLPTGTRNTDDQSASSPNLPGTGTTDLIANSNYTLQHGNSGINADATFTFTTPRKDSYKYGNKLSAGITGFYRFKRGVIGIAPQIGCRYEYAAMDNYNYQKDWYNTSSGGHVLSLTSGLLVSFKKTGLRASCQLPVNQFYAGGTMLVHYKLETGFFFLF